ncbi:outer membrane beta-barrel family protein [Maribacter sp. PR1]|uniref:Outer membrane beta-barrel family protein n=1 Tax=Maribacter cobaltidurans TaxID=1178778 RepID=A0ABU7IQR2_9FLAO|nr:MULTISPECIES: outer membrane beta-barrel family protein [Maribacter]MDC6387901.1 outer membrane beta-barrel family protein [Maribacter sp. PR1]MEE1975290.1 outer membrane beta-barrel family protein [Maribacter cobaltidurans]
MDYRKIVFLILVLNFIKIVAVQAQTIKGRVVDENGTPLEGYVSLSEQGDSTDIEKIELTDINGKFEFEEIRIGDYEIYFSFYERMTKFPNSIHITTINTNVELDDFVVENQNLELEEVVLIQKKPLVEQKMDRTVVNVDAVISNEGISALEVLEKSPGLRVDDNGGINLKGRPGVTVYIDDKPTYLSGADLASYLSSLPSSSLEAIEIMTNPPAKYDAAGNAGIINIKTKRNNIVGFNLGLNLSLIQHKYSETRDGLNFNFRKNKINVYGNFGYGTRNGFVNFYVDRNFKDEVGYTLTDFDQYSFIRRKGYQFTTTIGADFYQTDNTTWGIVVGGISRHPESTTNSTSTFTDANGVLDSLTTTRNGEDESFSNASINLNLRHNFREDGPSLGVDLDHIIYETGNEQNFDDRTYYNQDELTSQEVLIGNLSSKLKISSAKADYTHPFNNAVILSIGTKSSYTETDNSADYFSKIEADLIPDYDKTNQFLYDEHVHAGYVNLSKEYSKLSLQLGLRYEKTISKGYQLGNVVKPDSVFRRSYDGLFPTFFALYKIDSLENHQLRINYGRRIDRPYYQDLNPFITPLNKYTFYVGNPLLLPSFSNKVELSYILKKRTTATLGYSYSKNQVNETIEIENGLYFSRPGNIGSTELINFALDGNYDVTDWLRFQFYGSLDFVRIRSNFYDGLLEHKGTNGYLQGLCSFELPKDWVIQLDGNYRTKVTSGQFLYNSKGALNIGISKKLSERSFLSITGSDLLYTNINRGEIRNLDSTDARYKNLGDTRRILISYRLRLGKEFSSKPRHQSKGAEDEKNRVKH